MLCKESCSAYVEPTHTFPLHVSLLCSLQGQRVQHVLGFLPDSEMEFKSEVSSWLLFLKPLTKIWSYRHFLSLLHLLQVLATGVCVKSDLFSLLCLRGSNVFFLISCHICTVDLASNHSKRLLLSTLDSSMISVRVHIPNMTSAVDQKKTGLNGCVTVAALR